MGEQLSAEERITNCPAYMTSLADSVDALPTMYEFTDAVSRKDAIAACETHAEAARAQEREAAERDQSEQREMLWAEINALRERRNALEAENEKLRGLWTVTGGEMTKQTSRAERAEAALAEVTKERSTLRAELTQLRVVLERVRQDVKPNSPVRYSEIQQYIDAALKAEEEAHKP